MFSSALLATAAAVWSALAFNAFGSDAIRIGLSLRPTTLPESVEKPDIADVGRSLLIEAYSDGAKHEQPLGVENMRLRRYSGGDGHRLSRLRRYAGGDGHGNGAAPARAPEPPQSAPTKPARKSKQHLVPCGVCGENMPYSRSHRVGYNPLSFFTSGDGRSHNLICVRCHERKKAKQQRLSALKQRRRTRSQEGRSYFGSDDFEQNYRGCGDQSSKTFSNTHVTDGSGQRPFVSDDKARNYFGVGFNGLAPEAAHVLA